MPALARLTAADNIANIDPATRCYEGASARGQLKLPRQGQGWGLYTLKSVKYVDIGPASAMAMGLTECLAELGRGKVYWMVKGNDSMRPPKLPWTRTTGALPSLLYSDFVWDDATRDQWLASPHWARLDSLNARGGALDLEDITMPITYVYEKDNYDNIRFTEALAPITLTHNSSGYTYLGFTADMTNHMRFTNYVSQMFWQGDKTMLTTFKMMSGRMTATRLQAMYQEARPETLWFVRSLIKEAIRGHDEWVSNGGYTIAADGGLGPDLARRFEAAVRRQAYRDGGSDQAGDRLRELREVTSNWNMNKRVTLQNYFDAANDGVITALSQLLVFDEGWLDLSQEEKAIVLELWALEDENERRGVENSVATNGLAHTQGLANGGGTVRRTRPGHTTRRQAVSAVFGARLGDLNVEDSGEQEDQEGQDGMELD